VLATLYGHLGIDPAVTLPDHLGRPMYVLDDRDAVGELLAGLQKSGAGAIPHVGQ
jgi:hypothetical protein